MIDHLQKEKRKSILKSVKFGGKSHDRSLFFEVGKLFTTEGMKTPDIKDLIGLRF
jgi:hypothetical protein